MHLAQVDKIISGGQTGADLAALDFALAHKIAHGGWIPKGRRTENGPLPKKYNLIETSTPFYPERTEKNILASDGTIIFYWNEFIGGSLLTRAIALKQKRAALSIDLEKETDYATEARLWLKTEKIKVLNIAGPRLSRVPQIYAAVTRALEKIFFNAVHEKK